MTVRQIYFVFLLLSVFIFPIEQVYGGNICNPLIKPVTTDTTTSELLSELSKKYNFSLHLPEKIDRTVHIGEIMHLNQLIKLLTRDMNVILLDKTVEDCNEPILIELTVIQTGKDSEFLSVDQPAITGLQEYIYIDDMEKYVIEVLLRKRKSNRKKISPEQQEQFKATKNRLKIELKYEIQLLKRERKKNKNKKKHNRTQKNTDLKSPK